MYGVWAIKLIKELRNKIALSLGGQLLMMNMLSLVAGFVGVSLVSWLLFGALPGSAERTVALQRLELSNIQLAIVTLGLNLLIFSGTFLCLFRGKRRYLKEITDQTRQIGKGADIRVSVRGHDEITELCRTINTMSANLRDQLAREYRLEQEKIQIIQGMSHDLRTPITAQRGYLQLLKDKQYQSPEERDRFIAAALAKTEQLSSLVEELFEYTQLADQKRPLNKISFDYARMLEQVALDYMPLFDRAGIQVDLDIPKTPMMIHADAEKIARLLDNLFSNASKYTSPQGRIQIVLHKCQEKMELILSNTCPELAEQELQHLFDRFYRVEKSRSLRTGGAGLGLAIARRIVELHRGEIFAQYREGMISIHVRLGAGNQAGVSEPSPVCR